MKEQKGENVERNDIMGVVAKEDFTTTMVINGKEKEYTFPRGTIVCVPILLGMLDETIWGSTIYEFVHQRKNLCPCSMLFNSIGDTHFCPAKDFVVTMLVDMLQETGEV